MCDQTEITYDDGEVVWVKLGACWWPGQVVGFENLPEDIQLEFKKKPLIAVVQFFQEDKYEYVKNLQQIYKYNCTQKDDFIKKGLDKYRTKSKDGSSYMDKFPDDVVMAEKLTGGDVKILKDRKFSPEEKPDISSLFGEKKVPKKRRDKDDKNYRRSLNSESSRKMMPSRYSKSHDHEIRIRHQSNSQPTTPSTPSGALYSCPLCSFTSTRVNVIIYHNKSHRSDGWDSPRTFLPKSRSSLNSLESPKRKYVRKNKSFSHRSSSDRASESVKRKPTKPLEKMTKKKKSDPELREKLLADWDDVSDEDMSQGTTLNTSVESTAPESPPRVSKKDDDDVEKDETANKSDDADVVLCETEKLLEETDKISSQIDDSLSKEKVIEQNSLLKTTIDDDKNDQSGKSKLLGLKKFKKINSDEERRNSDNDKDDKSKFSCFDFDEEEPEPALPPVRKIARVFGEKNTSLKKEIIKEFTMSQALANEKDEEEKLKKNNEKKVVEDDKLVDEINKTVSEASDLVAKIASEVQEANLSKAKTEETETELEIVEILEVEKEKDEEETEKQEEKVTKNVPKIDQLSLDNHEGVKKVEKSSKEMKKSKSITEKKVIVSRIPELDSERVTIEEEDDNMPISQISAGSAGSDGSLRSMGWSQLNEIIGAAPGVGEKVEEKITQPTKKRRGRPRKVPLLLDVSGNGDSPSKTEESMPGTPDSQDTGRKTSESDTERSFTGRRRKPNKKYLESDIYSTSPGRRTPKTDDSQSETEEKTPKEPKKGRRGRKPGWKKERTESLRTSVDEFEFSDQTLDSAEESANTSVQRTKSPVKKIDSKPSPVHVTDLLTSSDVEIRGILQTESLDDDKQSKIEQVVVNDRKNEEEDKKKAEVKIEMLPPKKSQIKKFEASQADFSEENNKIQDDVCIEKVQFESTSMEIDQKKVPDEVPSVDKSQDDNVVTVIQIDGTAIAVNASVDVVQENIETILADEMVDQEKNKPKISKTPDEVNFVAEKATEKSEVDDKLDTNFERNKEKLLQELEGTPEMPKIEEKVKEEQNAVGCVITTETIEVVVKDKPIETPTSKPEVLEPSQESKIDRISELPSPAPTPSLSSEVSMPVKKREKPRIIENVQLKEPMHILKSKLLEKQPFRANKHKLDDSSKRNILQGIPKAKIMKIDSDLSSPSPPQMIMTPKLQVIKTEELGNEKIVTAIGVEEGEKVIQQTSQSLADMELDIDSIPFVLSEDLNPETVEQMPVVISPMIPASTAIPTPIAISSASQTSSNQIITTLPTSEPETITIDSSPKKKSPAILKSKVKAKPTITSIRTLHPPLTGGVKGLKFQNQAGKVPMKGSPGKFVIVQTSGNQQMRYKVQGAQKLPLPAGKTTANAQIVSQGGKVVILTSPQSGQTKMVPLANLSKGKVQKIVTKPGTTFSPVSKAPGIAPKTDESSPTTSKITPGTKLLSPKGVLSPVSAGGKTVIGNIPSGIIKGGVYTSLSTAGKTIIGSKTLVTNKGTLLSSLSGQGYTKTIVPSLSPANITSKTIITSAGLVPGKGTVLTPITGQQVKAIAAKNPVKTTKIQYQAIQQKVPLPMVQKIQKSQISTGSPVKNVKSSTQTIVFQNALQTTPLKAPPGKKIVRQHTLVASPTKVAPGLQQSPSGVSLQMLGKSKSAPPSVQKVQTPRGRSAKAKNIVVQTIQDTPPNPLKASQLIINQQKTVLHQQKQISSAETITKITKGQTLVKDIQQKILVVPSDTKDSNLDGSSTSTIESDVQMLEKTLDNSSDQIPPTEGTSTSEVVNEEQKVEESKPPTQIMALPTESSDGTQTYVLVTVDENGHIQPLDNNALLSLEGTTQNPDGTRTLYIDPSSLGESAGLENIVLQFDNGSLSNLQANPSEPSQPITSDSFPSSDIIQTSNQDILAAALANTDFQQEIGLPENPTTSVMTTGLTQTSLINQTILQSTIIPTSEPISSPSVLETSLTLNQPIMTPLEVPSNLPIQAETPSTITNPPTSLELPITITNPNISYIATERDIRIPENSMPELGDIMETPSRVEITSELPINTTQYLVISNLEENQIQEETTPSTSYAVSIPECISSDSSQPQTNPSMPIIDDNYSEETTEQIFNQETLESKPSDESLIQDSTDKEELKESLVDDLDKESVRGMPMVEIEEKNEDNTDNQVKESMEIDKLTDTQACESTETLSKVQSSVFESCETQTQEIAALEDVEKIQEVEESSMKSDELKSSTEEDVGIPTPVVVPIEVDEPGVVSDELEAAESSSPSEITQEIVSEMSQEVPSQSYGQFEASVSGDSTEIPSQSASKGESSREPSQSIEFQLEAMDQTESSEPPTQSFNDSQANEATQSENTDTPTQSSIERVQDDNVDDPNFPTQSYEVEKVENVLETMETDPEISQEGNIPSQSNDVGVDGIGTSSFSSNNSGLNEDETASSSYVPETPPDNQERDQDQESAISTSSYEIPTCEEINIASSSIPDTSVRVEHVSIHDNGVPEIPTSSYSLNPDSSSTHVDAVPTSSYDDQVIVEQNVSTSYEVPISMPGLEENSAQNFVSESSDQRDEPTSYYARHTEDVTSEASQSYFIPEGPSPSYTTQTASPSYYEPPRESEASQSFYSHEVERSEQSRNVEASQSFYQEATTDGLRLRQQGEATPTYTERYPVDYTLENSPMERHDLVESSVPATRPTER
ncbi:titin homolog [Chelonus insularis]|uniref:titin homolog n=1 Tax=Chelonus insularis TaxID=460826 RepID=UPI00158B4B0D|nr:titin homolog [Chelonus insularis]XP_034949243.1 titin homolog [Chelonus insularis]